MQKLSANQIRQMWSDFFARHEHLVLPSSSLIPHRDHSLLLINSGVATLKPFFTGQTLPPAPNLVKVQKCIRTNDIENVGKTARHHTFFEMLGNFSIGGYFKKTALELAHQFIFEELKLPKERIYITYHGEDLTTYNIWRELGIKEQHLVAGSRETNFWDLGQGPCGPDTEIFYDRGAKFDPKKQGIKLLESDIENDRYLEIWNIVFSEFDNDGQGNYQELSQKMIDTGAGLERLAAIFHDALTDFETDLFLPIIAAVEKLSPFAYDPQSKDDSKRKNTQAYRVIADHIRAVVMAIQDGVIPSRTARGYVIRRLIRRAYHAGYKLAIKSELFLSKLVGVVAKTLPVYPVEVSRVREIIAKEERLFARTMVEGEQLLLNYLSKQNHVDSQLAFKLFETYGYPLELTEEIAREHGAKVDLSQVEELTRVHQQKSRRQFQSGFDPARYQGRLPSKKVSRFIGYDHLSGESEVVFQTQAGDKWLVVTRETPFYATSGGQEHDQGTLNGVLVENVFKDKHQNHIHVLNQRIEDEKVRLEVDPIIRQKAARNHSATHLLGKALVEILGASVQLGSENNYRRLRLDFPHASRPSAAQISAVERLVNDYIEQDWPRRYIETTKEEALAMGAWALDNEQYQPIVRVVDFGISKELCGGTHVSSTAEIERFKIIRLDSKGSGVYRIEAITSNETISDYEDQERNKIREQVEQLVKKIKSLDPAYQLKFLLGKDSIITSELIETLTNDYKHLVKKQRKSQAQVNVVWQTIDYQGMPTFVKLDFAPQVDLKSLAVQLRSQHPESLIIVGSAVGQSTKVALASQTFDCQQIFTKLLTLHGGRGGGQKSLAMGIINASKLI